MSRWVGVWLLAGANPQRNYNSVYYIHRWKGGTSVDRLDLSFLTVLRTGVFSYCAIKKDLNRESSVWQGGNVSPGPEEKQEANMDRKR